MKNIELFPTKKQKKLAKKIIRLKEKGVFRQDAHKLLNVSSYQVYEICSLFNIKFPPKTSKVYKKGDTRVCNKCGIEKEITCFKNVKKVDDGYMSDGKICIKCHSKQTVIARDKKRTKPKRGNIYTEDLLSKIKENLLNTNKSHAEIAKILNISTNQVRLSLKKLELTEEERLKIKNRHKLNQFQESHYCIDCEKELSIDNFTKYVDKTGNTKIRSRCIAHDKIKAKSNSKNYIKNNKEKYLEVVKKHRQKKMITNPFFKVRVRISSSIHSALKSNDSSKAGKSCLPYLLHSITEMKESIEQRFSDPCNLTTNGEVWMSWKNWKMYNSSTWDDSNPKTWTWNLDHIIPQSFFKYKSMEDFEFKLCWSAMNLRPYSAKQNILDGANRTRHSREVFEMIQSLINVIKFIESININTSNQV